MSIHGIISLVDRSVDWQVRCAIMIVQHVSTGIKSEASDLVDLLEKVYIKKPESLLPSPSRDDMFSHSL